MTLTNDIKIIEVGGVFFVWSGYRTFGDIAECVTNNAHLFASFPYAMITCVDGGRGDWLTNLILNHTSGHKIEESFEVFGRGVLMSGRDFIIMQEADDFLSPFSEVWFFEEKPSITIPSDVQITAEVALVPQTDIYEMSNMGKRNQDNVWEWMIESNCALGMGDGGGMHFIARSKTTLWKALGSTILEQNITITYV